MESIKEIYRIGNGPSSSHTMEPKKAASEYLNKYSNHNKFRVTLYGSLALTGLDTLLIKQLATFFRKKN